MIRICLCLLIALASVTTAAAREVKMSSANGVGGSCQESHEPASHVPAGPDQPAAAAPARETTVKPSVHSDAAAGGIQTPRWHSFLPGMFR